MKSTKRKQPANFTCPSESNCEGALRGKTIDYRFRYQGREIVVPDVEVWVCDGCGEQVFPYESARKIETYKKYSGRLNLRINPEMHAELARRAKEHHQSLNQETSQLLEASLNLTAVKTKKVLVRSFTRAPRIARRR
jgi:YgiT-type zinc finger domain-containing protein